jgi:hypothetical protein
MSPPLALTDSQITAIFALTRPLTPHQRVAFLEMLAHKLNGQHEWGGGALHRLCCELQRELFSPPQFDRDEGGKYDRILRRARG